MTTENASEEAVKTPPKRAKKNSESANQEEKGRTTFDTEMIRATSHMKNKRVRFHLSDGEILEAVPVIVDKYMILVAIDGKSDEKEWIQKLHIVRCRLIDQGAGRNATEQEREESSKVNEEILRQEEG